MSTWHSLKVGQLIPYPKTCQSSVSSQHILPPSQKFSVYQSFEDQMDILDGLYSLMGKRCCLFSLYFLGLSWLIQVAVAGREGPLLQSYEKGSFGYSGSFNRIFDTSKYGILQLKNGLARTPQMGSLTHSLASSIYLSLCLFAYHTKVMFFNEILLFFFFKYLVVGINGILCSWPFGVHKCSVLQCSGNILFFIDASLTCPNFFFSLLSSFLYFGCLILHS